MYQNIELVKHERDIHLNWTRDEAYYIVSEYHVLLSITSFTKVNDRRPSEIVD